MHLPDHFFVWMQRNYADTGTDADSCREWCAESYELPDFGPRRESDQEKAGREVVWLPVRKGLIGGDCSGSDWTADRYCYRLDGKAEMWKGMEGLHVGFRRNCEVLLINQK